MFEKTLQDVVKGIRASKRDTALYISQCIAEIKTEINSSDMYVKANALQKLTFLQMMGYGTSWASFTTIEVMSSPRFAHKRIGYLAATQGFTQDTEVVLLATNLLKKELRGAIGGGMNGVYEAGLAINCVSNIVTEDLAQDLLPEISNLTKHPQPYLRKKAVLCLFKVFVKYPQGLRLTFAQIQQCLSDTNPSVVSCAVNVITELSDKNPRNYLHLAPAFFELLTSSSNNWMLIKVVKLLGSLVPEEPRLARKLLEPLAGIVGNTPAKSLLFEAAHAITLCLPYCRKNDGTMPAVVPDIVTLCAKTFRDFVEEEDQNLKYLGLVGFGSLMQSHPKVLAAADYRPLILACLSDEDVTIRSRALGLLTGMTSRKNLMELVSQLMQHVELATGTYKFDLVFKIIEMCSGEKYALLQDFSWYLDILFQLGHMRGLDAHAELLRAQITDIALRVLPVRAYAVRRSVEVLLERDTGLAHSLEGMTGDNGRGKHLIPQILPAVAWIVGEYSDLIPEAVSMEDSDVYIFNEESEGPYHSIIQVLTTPSNISNFACTTQKVYIQASMKVFAAATKNCKVADAEVEACVKSLWHNLKVFVQSPDTEVQERALTSLSLLKALDLEPGVSLNANLRNRNANSEANLLGMASSKTVADETKLPTRVAAKSRKASSLLNYSLKVSPMKPSSIKLQRKKHQTPQHVDADINSPLDLSIFTSLLRDEAATFSNGKVRLESVTFTQQTLLLTKNTKGDTVSAAHIASELAKTTFEHGELLQSHTFQQLDTSNTTLPAVEKRSEGLLDPFYLNSSKNTTESKAANITNRFGTIELDDGESEGEVDDTKQKAKKKKKKKSSKRLGSTPGVDASSNGVSSSNGRISPSALNRPTIYSSGDEEDEDNALALAKPINSRKEKPRTEFSGLAKVDLTMPLRDDEVMPERTHYVVPSRSHDIQPELKHPLKIKKKKKGSKKNKKAHKENPETLANRKSGDMDTGDLLNLFDAAPLSPAPEPNHAVIPPQSGMQSLRHNPIDNVFDDLLLGGTLTNGPPSQESSVYLPLPNPGKTPKLSKRAWMRATIKTSHTSGSPNVDWSKVVLSFRLADPSQGETSTSIIARVENNNAFSLADLKLKLKGGEISLGTIASGQSTESPKSSPIHYKKADEGVDIKGTLVTVDCGVSIKLSLPATFFLAPLEGLSLDNIAAELQSPGWSSHSLRLEIHSAEVPSEKIKALLCKFLNATEVSPGASGGGNGTFAAKSIASTAQVRVLVKVKNGAAKVDVKSTNPSLGKALVSDLKRLIL